MNSTFYNTVHQYIAAFVFNLLIVTKLAAQNSVCPIGIPIAMPPSKEVKNTSFTREIMAPNNLGWTDIHNLKFADDKKAVISLPTTKRARTIIGNNFRFQIPTGATIHGITVVVEGQSTNSMILDEIQVQLVGADGIPTGENKANTAKLQKAWSANEDGSDRMWMYGSPTDLWKHNWTAEQINSQDFGYMLQIRNKHVGNLDVAIDQIFMIVDYTPIYTVCDDKCLTFYIDLAGRQGRYEWKVPNGFTLASRDLHMRTIDLKHTNAPYGLHEICVDIYDHDNNYVETCCRKFHFQDCTSSRIEGVAWLDINANQLRDINEDFVPNVRLVLFNKNNQPVDTVFTNAQGKYSFEGLPEGQFYVRAPELPDHRLLLSNGVDSDRDSDITNANGPRTTSLIQTEIGKTVFNVDFGYAPIISIGDFVWVDANYDGLQSLGEPGIANVKVILCNEAGARIDSVTTATDGKYLFSNLVANKYRVKFFQNSSALLPTFRNSADPVTNSDIDDSGKTTLLNFITPGPKLDVDAGFFEPAALGGVAWEDKNGDGQYQIDESILPNIEIKLTGTTGAGQVVMETALTRADGSYVFDDLAPGNYNLEWKLPTNYFWTTRDQGPEATDNDVDTFGRVSNITLVSGDSLNNIFGGMYRYGAIGDFVWHDLNGNGIQELNEPGIENSSIMLLKNAVVIAETLTDDNGAYAFDSLIPGNYNIRIQNFDGRFIATAKDKTDDSMDSDAADYSIDNIMVMSGMNMDNIDAGFVILSNFGNRVWLDKNANGIQDHTESGIPNVTVTIKGTQGDGIVVDQSSVTNNEGNYNFNQVWPGEYNITMMIPENYVITYKDQGTSDSLDNDFNSSGVTENVIVVSNSSIDYVDGGLYQYGTIGNFVWEDLDANGSQDIGEPGIEGITVNLTGITGNGTSITRTTVTDSNGAYTFSDLIPGLYQINISSTLQETAKNIGDPNADSNLEGSISDDIMIMSGTVDNTIDAGFYEFGSITGFVWTDKDGNGLKSLNEGGKSAMVTLSGTDGLGNLVNRITIAGDDGIYSFDNLVPGNYTLMFMDLDGFKFTLPNAGDDNIDSDVVLNEIGGIVVRSGANLSGFGTGYIKAINIGDFVWNDTNLNGIQDPTEPGMAGVIIMLTGTDVTGISYNQTVASDIDGNYVFEGIYPGNYTISVENPNGFIPTLFQQGNEDLDNNLDPLNANTSLQVATDNDIVNLDFGFVKTGSIGDLVWEDLNCNNILDPNESGIPNISLMLNGTSFYNTAIFQTTTSDINGAYKFENLPPGNYSVTASIPDGYFLGQGVVNIANIANGSTLDNIDIPLFRKGSIGDMVWVDENEDGIFQATESGLEGVTITLNSVNLSPQVTLQSTTNSVGKYNFDSLKPGVYSLTFSTPLNYIPTLALQGNSDTDSDIDATGIANNVTIFSGQNRLDIDAGYIQTNKANIQGLVWEDKNGDGIRNATEIGISQVIIELLSMSNEVLSMTTTDNNGAYTFSNLLPGEYRIRAVTNLGITRQNVGNDDTDSDISPIDGVTETIIVTTNSTNANIDAGLFRFASIGDFVWLDSNKDGIQQADENGISNVTVTINGVTDPSFTQQTTTNTSGMYAFNNLIPGEYSLQFTQPIGQGFTIQSAGTERNLDSDVNPNGVSPTIMLMSGEQNTSVDAGLLSLTEGGIFGQIWEDKNADGQFATPELGLENVTVELYSVDNDGNRTLVTTTGSSATGDYAFIGLGEGNYVVVVKPANSYVFTPSNVGDDATDSDFDLLGESQQFSLSTNEVISNIDGGVFRYASIGDFVWLDSNKDGIQQADENGISDVTITINGVTDPSFTQQTTANTSGMYAFNNLIPGEYSLQFTQPVGQGFTIQGAGTERNLDSDVNPNGVTSTIMLMSGEQNTTIDAGLISLTEGAIFGKIWEDKNADGQYVTTELGLENVTVELYSVDNNGNRVLSATTTTNSSGEYTFNSLTNGDYLIKVLADTNYIFTKSNIGNDDIDSDVNLMGETEIFTVDSNQGILKKDAGLYRLGSIGDFVWFDKNKDGIQNDDEKGFEGTVFTLKDQNGSIIAQAMSDENGNYSFTELVPGIYTLTATVPDGYIPTLFNNGNDNANSDFLFDGEIALTNEIMIMSGQENDDIDLGFINAAGSISGTVWCDDSGDGIRDANEPKIPNVKVFLFNSMNQFVQLDTTDNFGNYTFKGLIPGSYMVRFDKVDGKVITLPNVGPIETDSDAEGLDNQTTQEISINTSTDIFNIDCGFVRTSSVGDFAWIDANNDGLQNLGETGQNGIKVVLLSGNGVRLDSTLTDLDPVNNMPGYYTFDGLPYGDYIIQFELPTNFSYTISNLTDLNLNSDVSNTSTGATDVFTLLPNQNKKDIDAGFIIMNMMDGTISGFTWLDKDGDRVRGANDEFLANKVIFLYDLNQNLVNSALTDANGFYEFTNLSVGDYYIQGERQNNEVYVPYGGMPAPNDSDITGAFGEGTTRTLTVFPGGTLTNIDVGVARIISIGDFAWEDINVNGLQDPDEPGLPGVVVELRNSTDILIARDTTDANGEYLIENVPTGFYTLKFEANSTFTPTFEDISSPTINSDIDADGTTILLDLTAIQPYRDIDAGFIKFGCIGDQVWLDLNGNGLIQSGESGVPNIKIYLYSESGILVDSTLTSSLPENIGKYKFQNVVPGKYYLEFVIPDTFMVSQPNFGPEDSDSDITDTNGPFTTDIINLGSGQIITDVDAAIYIPSTIGDRVWKDINGNGIQDTGEPGIADIEVFLYAQNGQFISSTTTDINGFYKFDGLRQRLYFLQFSIPEGFIPAPQNQGNLSNLDSDIDETGSTALISLAHGVKLLDVDAGMIETNFNIVKGTVWNDEDEDGLRDFDESIVEGIDVSLLNAAGNVIATTKTNTSGAYSFFRENGSYSIFMKAPSQYLFTVKNVINQDLYNSNINESGYSEPFDFSQSSQKQVNAGIYKSTTARLEGVVWFDKNNNNIRETSDSLMSNVLVLLFNQQHNFIKSTATDINGRYIFTQIPSGKYYIRTQAIDGLDWVYYSGNNQDKDSEITNQFGPGTTRLLTLNSGGVYAKFDIGFTRSGLRPNDKTTEERAELSELSIYPNPVFRNLNISNPAGEELPFIIVDPNNVEIMKGTIPASGTSIDVTEFKTSMYYLKIITKHGIISKPILKIDNR